MITVVKEFTFDAAHKLLRYDGPCANIHGHTYKLQIGIKGLINSETGMVVDFGEVKALVKPFVEHMDHSFLNDLSNYNKPSCYLPGFPEQPTAENMVQWLAEVISKELEAAYGYVIVIDFIRLWETPTSYAEWSK